MKLFWLSLITLGAGLAQSPAYLPKLEDARLTRGAAFVDQASIAPGALNAPGSLNIAGNVPTPCHELRVNIPSALDGAGVLAIQVYSVTDPHQICAQILKPFTASVTLSPTQLRASITVNGKSVSAPSK